MILPTPRIPVASFLLLGTLCLHGHLRAEGPGHVGSPAPMVGMAPVAVQDSFSTPAGTALEVSAAIGVLANDGDAWRRNLVASVVQAPAHGTLSLQADGSFTYLPAAGHFGPDSFTYAVHDGKLQSAPAVVRLAVVRPLCVQVVGTSVHEESSGILNAAKAGRIVPIRFRITDASQNGVYLPELLVSGTLSASAGSAPGSPSVEFDSAGDCGLVYTGNGYYQLNWATSKDWANSLQLLTLSFEAVHHSFASAANGDLRAKFHFRR